MVIKKIWGNDNVRLTNRERDVANCIGSGLKNADISKTLNIEPKTVERHISGIFSKLNGEAKGLHPRVYIAMQVMNGRWDKSHKEMVFGDCGNCPEKRSLWERFIDKIRGRKV